MVAPGVAFKRKLTKEKIEENPTEININRETKSINAAGGISDTGGDLPIQTVRIFLKDSDISESITEGGQSQEKKYGMLAAYDADIKIGDKFGKYEVDDVTPVSYRGEIISYQCVIREVKEMV